jgi:hypothetical protein
MKHGTFLPPPPHHSVNYKQDLSEIGACGCSVDPDGIDLIDAEDRPKENEPDYDAMNEEE